MATIDTIDVKRTQNGLALSILFSFRTTKEHYYRSIRFGKNDSPADVAENLRRLADQIDDSKQLKKR